MIWLELPADHADTLVHALGSVAGAGKRHVVEVFLPLHEERFHGYPAGSVFQVMDDDGTHLIWWKG